ncbi:hypothetical protein MUK72_19395 (plasmid) [Halococcus dombrowskii]|uniref:Uncharacterized protein n=1 Tax=Halococcus dombrowskii TaxID=179637 RepID=A0AAV3SIA1_HALDO|nr:hypothetical protein [Halococcus dombrowskii]UOO97316.1 hypothetical protein MUK72_19395 [Halococcus dombrowskii]
MVIEWWRYCYPECRAHSRVSRTNLGGYRCGTCGAVIERRYDKKHGDTNSMIEDCENKTIEALLYEDIDIMTHRVNERGNDR